MDWDDMVSASSAEQFGPGHHGSGNQVLSTPTQFNQKLTHHVDLDSQN